ncbi:MAG: hypothetical protein ACFNLJ_06175, partial [Selenomonas artemidis]
KQRDCRHCAQTYWAGAAVPNFFEKKRKTKRILGGLREFLKYSIDSDLYAQIRGGRRGRMETGETERNV